MEVLNCGWVVNQWQYTDKQYDPYMFCTLLFLHQQPWLWNHLIVLDLWYISVVLYFQHSQWFAPSICLKCQTLLICWIPGWSKETRHSISDETSQEVSKPNYCPLGNCRGRGGGGGGHSFFGKFSHPFQVNTTTQITRFWIIPNTPLPPPTWPRFTPTLLDPPTITLGRVWKYLIPVK